MPTSGVTPPGRAVGLREPASAFSASLVDWKGQEGGIGLHHGRHSKSRGRDRRMMGEQTGEFPGKGLQVKQAYRGHGQLQG